MALIKLDCIGKPLIVKTKKIPRKDSEMTIDKIAYLAGIIDGEGNIGINHTVYKNKKGDRYRVRLTICNTDIELLEWIVSNFGGNYYLKKSYNKNHKISANWTVGDKKAEEIIKLVYPYLIIKKKPADLVVSYRKLQNLKIQTYKNKYAFPEEIRREVHVVIKKLNSRGRKSVETNTSNTNDFNNLLVKIESELDRNIKNQISDNLVK